MIQVIDPIIDNKDYKAHRNQIIKEIQSTKHWNPQVKSTDTGKKESNLKASKQTQFLNKARKHYKQFKKQTFLKKQRTLRFWWNRKPKLRAKKEETQVSSVVCSQWMSCLENVLAFI